jgi:hypothetical protein
MILAVLHAAGRPMTTYELGLYVTDDHDPPRPLSVIVKSLVGDKYIRRSAKVGKRTISWLMDERGIASIERRPEVMRIAADILAMASNRTDQEKRVVHALRAGAETLTQIIADTGLTTSPTRTAIRRLMRRGDVVMDDERRYRVTGAARDAS